MEENQKEKDDQKQFDIVWLIKYLFNKRKYIIRFTCICVALCFVIFLLKPAKYRAQASILPISDNKMSNLGNLGSLASFAGVDINSLNPSKSIITADLYPRVASSTPFLLQMADVKVKWNKPDTIMSYYEYVKADTVMTFMKYLKAYTIGLPGTISQMFQGKQSQSQAAPTSVLLGEPQYLNLNPQQKLAIALLGQKIVVEEDASTNLIIVSAFGESPLQASVWASEAVNQLQATIASYKTKQAQLSLDFIEDRYKETQDEYEQIRQAFFQYKDSHRDMIDERVDIEYQRLEDQYQISYSVLKSLSSQMEQAKIKLMEDTPAFSIVDPVVLPMANEKFSPKFALHVIAGIMLGIILSIGWLLMQLGYWQVFNEEKIKKIIEENK
ncbi:MAG: hypothetical protein J6Y82_03510 [Bacteroidales bacterium]|nr:hypothetical protein [Bacteroidales bacterium]